MKTYIIKYIERKGYLQIFGMLIITCKPKDLDDKLKKTFKKNVEYTVVEKYEI